jgi:hypothetical protein
MLKDAREALANLNRVSRPWAIRKQQEKIRKALAGHRAARRARERDGRRHAGDRFAHQERQGDGRGARDGRGGLRRHAGARPGPEAQPVEVPLAGVICDSLAASVSCGRRSVRARACHVRRGRGVLGRRTGACAGGEPGVHGRRRSRAVASRPLREAVPRRPLAGAAPSIACIGGVHPGLFGELDRCRGRGALPRAVGCCDADVPLLAIRGVCSHVLPDPAGVSA